MTERLKCLEMTVFEISNKTCSCKMYTCIFFFILAARVKFETKLLLCVIILDFKLSPCTEYSKFPLG